MLLPEDISLAEKNRPVLAAYEQEEETEFGGECKKAEKSDRNFRNIR